eukprot:TRINITY_DN34197_c0_g1_i1.p1 TRINITY_DN34197_c0_g1~~TRINITY_DN34197_c0_g1_i1.p1  ORF type:complete len:422 (+),score=127.91 TRINITY_DN34197_c0_g1_i1:86-1267(+)
MQPLAGAWSAGGRLALAGPLFRGRRGVHRRFAATAAEASQEEAAASLPPPFRAIREDLGCVAKHMPTVVRRTDSTRLEQGAVHLLQNPGKMLRPALCALAGYATLPFDDARCRELHGLSRAEIIAAASHDKDLSSLDEPFVKHLWLGEVIELIHTGSLLHDDVIDGAEVRRGRPALHVMSGVATAVHSGDFLLSRACRMLNTLGSAEVTRTVARSLEDLIIGEALQLEGVRTMESYYRKCFCKASSLIAHGCRAAAMLSDPDDTESHDALWTYGSHLGIAFQVIDDVLDYTGTGQELGKPALADLSMGLATLPVLLAAEDAPELQAMIDRKFSEPGDVDAAMAKITETDSIGRSRAAAKREADLAAAAVSHLPESEQKQALIHVTRMVLDRKK